MLGREWLADNSTVVVGLYIYKVMKQIIVIKKCNSYWNNELQKKKKKKKNQNNEIKITGADKM